MYVCMYWDWNINKIDKIITLFNEGYTVRQKK